MKPSPYPNSGTFTVTTTQTFRIVTDSGGVKRIERIGGVQTTVEPLEKQRHEKVIET